MFRHPVLFMVYHILSYLYEKPQYIGVAVFSKKCYTKLDIIFYIFFYLYEYMKEIVPKYFGSVGESYEKYG